MKNFNETGLSILIIAMNKIVVKEDLEPKQHQQLEILVEKGLLVPYIDIDDKVLTPFVLSKKGESLIKNIITSVITHINNKIK